MAEEKVYAAKDWSRNVYIISASSKDEARAVLFNEGLSKEDLEKFETVSAYGESRIVKL